LRKKKPNYDDISQIYRKINKINVIYTFLNTNQNLTGIRPFCACVLCAHAYVCVHMHVFAHRHIYVLTCTYAYRGQSLGIWAGWCQYAYRSACPHFPGTRIVGVQYHVLLLFGF
ncbi:mCG145981, partial [Mus musculus]